jgi:hypothetical protein
MQAQSGEMSEFIDTPQKLFLNESKSFSTNTIGATRSIHSLSLTSFVCPLCLSILYKNAVLGPEL